MAKDIMADPDQSERLMQLHLVEYETLQTRNNYWLAFQIALWPILVISWGFLAEINKNHPQVSKPLLVSISDLVAQLVMLQYYKALFETYNNVKYVECHLRPLVVALVGNNPFWRYERFLNGNRGLAASLWDYAPLAVSLIPVGVNLALFFRGPLFFAPLRASWFVAWNRSAIMPILVFLASVAVFSFVLRMAWKSVKARKDFSEVLDR